MTEPDGTSRQYRQGGYYGFGVALLAALLLVVVGCAQLREWLEPTAPGLPPEWAELLEEIRGFERRIGFTETDNFASISEDQQGYPFCGFAPRLTLPYSYEDPAIQWRDAATEEDCARLAAGADHYFSTVEALGEVGSPVTLSMIESKLDRFLYLVIHEDCHDQFELPYGIEEALCNVVAYKAMAAFTDEKFGSHAREDRAVRRYAALESKRTHATKEYYEQLAALYERHGRGEIPEESLMAQRGHILALAARAEGWQGGPYNNIVLASHMTYSRHYPFLEGVFDALGRDLARTVAFFRHVDKTKPSAAAVMKRAKIRSRESVEFVRAYEAAVVETVKRELPAAQRQR